MTTVTLTKKLSGLSVWSGFLPTSAFCLLAFLFTLPPVWALTPPKPTEPLPDLVERIIPSVVNISSSTVVNYSAFGWDDFLQFWGVPSERKHTSLGSGFVIDREGYILTNNHVVEHAQEVLVNFMGKTQYRAVIIGSDAKLDLALLKLQPKKGEKLPDLTPAMMGDSDFTRIAEEVIAIGNPFGLQHTVTRGIISAKNRTIGLGPLDNFLQTDASINPGNSGGPLFNRSGQVIGINTLIYSKTGQSGGLGFAIPVNEAKAVLASLKRYGRVPRPWLGVLTENLNRALARYYRLKRSDGVLVYRLVRGGPADHAGLEPGDIIFEINGVATTENISLERELFRFKPKDKIVLTVQRGRKKMKVNIDLNEFPPAAKNLPQGTL